MLPPKQPVVLDPILEDGRAFSTTRECGISDMFVPSDSANLSIAQNGVTQSIMMHANPTTMMCVACSTVRTNSLKT